MTRIAVAASVACLCLTASPAAAQIDRSGEQAIADRVGSIDRQVAVLEAEAARLDVERGRLEVEMLDIERRIRNARETATEARDEGRDAQARMSEARARLRRTKAALKLAEGQLQRTEQALRQQVDASPRLAALQSDMQTARDRLEAVKDRLLDPLRASAKYQDAAAAASRARQELRAQQDSEVPLRSRVIAAANRLLEAQEVMTELERAVLYERKDYHLARAGVAETTLQFWMERVSLSVAAFLHPMRIETTRQVRVVQASAADLEAALAAAEADASSARAIIRTAAVQFTQATKAQKKIGRQRDYLVTAIAAKERTIRSLLLERDRLVRLLRRPRVIVVPQR